MARKPRTSIQETAQNVSDKFKSLSCCLKTSPHLTSTSLKASYGPQFEQQKLTATICREGHVKGKEGKLSKEDWGHVEDSCSCSGASSLDVSIPCKSRPLEVSCRTGKLQRHAEGRKQVHKRKQMQKNVDKPSCVCYSSIEC